MEVGHSGNDKDANNEENDNCCDHEEQKVINRQPLNHLSSKLSILNFLGGIWDRIYAL